MIHDGVIEVGHHRRSGTLAVAARRSRSAWRVSGNVRVVHTRMPDNTLAMYDPQKHSKLSPAMMAPKSNLFEMAF